MIDKNQIENKSMKQLKRTIKLNAPLKGLPKDTVLKIKVDSKGTPIERYWRDRFKDAQIDNCVEFVKEEKKIETKKK